MDRSWYVSRTFFAHHFIFSHFLYEYECVLSFFILLFLQSLHPPSTFALWQLAHFCARDGAVLDAHNACYATTRSTILAAFPLSDAPPVAPVVAAKVVVVELEPLTGDGYVRPLQRCDTLVVWVTAVWRDEVRCNIHRCLFNRSTAHRTC